MIAIDAKREDATAGGVYVNGGRKRVEGRDAVVLGASRRPSAGRGRCC